jgi:hypothetical protein
VDCEMTTLQNICIGAVVLFSALAGGAWLRAATAKICAPKINGKPIDFRITAGDDSYEIIADGVDVGRTLALQSKWNTSAAALTCVAAFFQAVQALLAAKLLG